ncbi:MAG: hypothetical protein BroJett012_20580 [Betaproteobacteria bacterium]|nr:MAG: hypothetical protein BroJett012_20580 [Betaproteobacteria bacterium]
MITINGKKGGNHLKAVADGIKKLVEGKNLYMQQGWPECQPTIWIHVRREGADELRIDLDLAPYGTIDYDYSAFREGRWDEEEDGRLLPVLVGIVRENNFVDPEGYLQKEAWKEVLGENWELLEEKYDEGDEDSVPAELIEKIKELESKKIEEREIEVSEAEVENNIEEWIGAQLKDGIYSFNEWVDETLEIQIAAACED